MMLQVRARDRMQPSPADRTTVGFLRRVFGAEKFTTAEAQAKAVEFYTARNWPRRTPGIPEGLPAWRTRLRGLYLCGMVEHGPGGFRLVKEGRR